LLSVAPAILSSALALVLVRRGDLKGWRLNDGIWDWDLTTNHVFMSPRLLGILGCEAGEVDSVDAWMQHVHADDRDALKATFVCHLRRETETFSAISRARFRPATWSAS
jgi:PAS domain-containing protein